MPVWFNTDVHLCYIDLVWCLDTLMVRLFGISYIYLFGQMPNEPHEDLYSNLLLHAYGQGHAVISRLRSFQSQSVFEFYRQAGGGPSMKHCHRIYYWLFGLMNTDIMVKISIANQRSWILHMLHRSQTMTRCLILGWNSWSRLEPIIVWDWYNVCRVDAVLFMYKL